VFGGQCGHGRHLVVVNEFGECRHRNTSKVELRWGLGLELSRGGVDY
jgi:hypothetical protein